MDAVIKRPDDRLFRTYVEDHSIPVVPRIQTALLEIRTLTSEQIDTFLAKFDREFVESCWLHWGEVKASLLDIYDLGDLMTRPIILSMIKDTMIHGRIDVTNKRVLRGASDLYEKYTEVHLRRDWSKGKARRRLSIDARRLFAEAIAITMLRTGRLAVSYGEIKDLIAGREWPELSSLRRQLKSSPDELAGDVQVSMFLSRSEETFRFARKSFMEFFLARRILQDFSKGEEKGIRASLRMLLPKEALYFVGNVCAYNQAVLEAVKRAFRDAGSDRVVKRNLAGMILNSGKDIPSIYFHCVELFELGCGATNWGRLSFVDSQFSRVTVTNTTLQGCVMRGCVCDDVHLEP